MGKDTYLLKNPQDSSFYKVIIAWLTVTGQGSSGWWGIKINIHWFIVFFSKFIKLIAGLAILSQMLYMVTHRQELNAQSVGAIMAVLPVTCIVFINSIASELYIYKRLMQEFMFKIHMYNFKHEHVNTEAKLIRIERAARYTSCFLIACIMIDWLSWTTMPIATNIMKMDQIRNNTATLDVFIYFWTPFDYTHNINNWIIVHTLDVFLGWYGCSVVSVFNSLVFIFVFHLIGHIKALNDKIKYDLKDVTNDEEVSKKLTKIIEYHIFIKRIFADIKSAFGLSVTSNYIHNLIGDSILLYEVMFGGKSYLVTHGLMFILYMGGLIMLSFVLEEIKIQSDRLSDTAYNIPWEDMSQRNKKTFLVFLNNLQQPLEFIGAGGLRAGVNPMISIIKSTFSYYVMLKSRDM